MTAHDPSLALLPLPRDVRWTAERFLLPGRVTLRLGGRFHPPAEAPALARLISRLEAGGTGVALAEHGPADVALDLDEGSSLGPEAYRLAVENGGVRVHAATEAGLAQGARTLAQLVDAAFSEPPEGAPPTLPGVRIDDAPSFPERGVMLDVSRDRVPTMETLFALVERLASWKLNRLQLYTEHTFAYSDHEPVWRGADPLTAEEVRALDRFCAARHVELVPNQQCFGHMHRWLVHARYRPLAECPEGVEHPFTRGGREPFSLCPTDARSLELISGLLDELLPCFESGTVNVGCDETFDLGRGRSRAACEARGVGRVYLEYLLALAELVAERGKRMQFWADIVLSHPELVGELPSDVVPMLWGYEAGHPYAEETEVLAASGLAYHVCPGTSSWQSLAGRFANAMANVEAAARAGEARGARGLLVTDWGDRGHLQPLPVSYPGWLAGADLAWNAASPRERRSEDAMARLLDRHALEDPAGAAGRAAVALARAGERTGASVPNASPLFRVLTSVESAFPPPGVSGLTAEGLARAEELALDALATLHQARMVGADAGTVKDELTLAGELVAFAARLGRTRLDAGPGRGLADLSPADRRRLAAELAPLAARHRELWLRRSRPGGLEASAAWLEEPLERLSTRGA